MPHVDVDSSRVDGTPAMNAKKVITRKDAVDELARHGIRGADLYLVDVIPLIEMVWADGHTQDGELDILNGFLREHVAHVNKIAGYAMLTFDHARKFVGAFIEERPDPALLRALRDLIPQARLSSSDEEHNARLRKSMLAACLDIAASSVTNYPYPLRERFNMSEKQCLFEILESMG